MKRWSSKSDRLRIKPTTPPEKLAVQPHLGCLSGPIPPIQDQPPMMINQSMASSNPDVERLIREMLSENARYERDLRSAHRENLVFPVSIQLPDSEDVRVSGFSRNVSATGVCILCDTSIESGIIATLEIFRLHKPEPSRVRAECRWSKPFGEAFYASGWQFIGLARD